MPVRFGAFLQALRNKKHARIEDLASAASLHIATAYKAEQDGPVRWKTVKQIYASLCDTPSEKAELIARWAVSLDPEFAASEDVHAAMDGLAIEAGERAFAAEFLTSQVLKKRRLTEEERETIDRFITRYLDHEPTRKMAGLWLDALDSEKL